MFGFSKVEERVRWEEWIINLSILKPNDDLTQGNCSQWLLILIGNIGIERKEKLDKDLRKLLTGILRIVNENKNHVPPLTNKDLTPFPYEVSEILLIFIIFNMFNIHYLHYNIHPVHYTHCILLIPLGNMANSWIRFTRYFCNYWEHVEGTNFNSNADVAILML